MSNFELPFNIEAEQCVLGALLTNNDSIDRVADYLQADHFYEPVHRRIYGKIVAAVNEGKLASPTTLKSDFDKDPALVDRGGAAYLLDLSRRGMSIINLESYGQVVYNAYVKRSLVTIGKDIISVATNNKDEADACIEKAEQDLFNLSSAGSYKKDYTYLRVPLSKAVEEAGRAHKRTDKICGMPTKFADLDLKLGGLQNSDLIILAGRPSMGKTAFAVNLAFNACLHLLSHKEEYEKPPSVGVFSLEMSSEQLAARMIAMEAGVDSSRMRAGCLNDDEFSKVVQASGNLHSMPLIIDDTAALSISSLRTKARRMKRKDNVCLIIVDYLQLLRGSAKRSDANRVQEVSEITQGLKAIAKELDIPVIALSQLSRAVEQREDKRPQLSDLRESGSIEQDADIVMFIYREEYYLSRKIPAESSMRFIDWQREMKQCSNQTEIIVAKHRNGPIGSVKLYFDAGTTKFQNLLKT